MTRIAGKPAYCASCFGTPDGRYVDFEAAYDGPVIPGTPEPVPVDDLILCEGCLQEAFDLLDPQGLKETIAKLSAAVEDAESTIKERDRAIQGFRNSTNALVDTSVRRNPGKPHFEGLPPEMRKEFVSQQYKRKGSSPAGKRKKEETPA